MEMSRFETGKEFKVAHLTGPQFPLPYRADCRCWFQTARFTVRFSVPTLPRLKSFWKMTSRATHLEAAVIEASSLLNARAPQGIKAPHASDAADELHKLSHNGMDILAGHLKPAYREPSPES